MEHRAETEPEMRTGRRVRLKEASEETSMISQHLPGVAFAARVFRGALVSP
jgi:hypothetical protein